MILFNDVEYRLSMNQVRDESVGFIYLFFFCLKNFFFRFAKRGVM